MNASIVNDDEGRADRIARILRRIEDVSAISQIWDVNVTGICDQIQTDDLVILDVNLGPLGDSGGFEVFSHLIHRHYDSSTGNFRLSVIFDSGEACREKLTDWLPKNQHGVLNQLRQRARVVFSEDFRHLEECVRTAIRGFSFAEAYRMLLDPFLPLHIAVQHLQNNDPPNPDLFRPMKEFDFSFEADRQEAGKYAEAFGLDQVGRFINGYLQMLCEILTNESDPQERLDKIRALAEGLPGTTFLSEFEQAVEALRARG